MHWKPAHEQEQDSQTPSRRKLLYGTIHYIQLQPIPIHLDTRKPDTDLTPGTTISDVVAFLYNNPEFGYRPAEIRDELAIPHGTATATLKRLHEIDYAGKTSDGYYHALESREDLRRYVAALDQLDRMVSHSADEGHASRPDAERVPSENVDDDELEAELDEELQDQISCGDSHLGERSNRVTR